MADVQLGWAGSRGCSLRRRPFRAGRPVWWWGQRPSAVRDHEIAECVDGTWQYDDRRGAYCWCQEDDQGPGLAIVCDVGGLPECVYD